MAPGRRTCTDQDCRVQLTGTSGQKSQGEISPGSVLVASKNTGSFEQVLLDGRHILMADEPAASGGGHANIANRYKHSTRASWITQRSVDLPIIMPTVPVPITADMWSSAIFTFDCAKASTVRLLMLSAAITPIRNLFANGFRLLDRVATGQQDHVHRLFELDQCTC